VNPVSSDTDKIRMRFVAAFIRRFRHRGRRHTDFALYGLTFALFLGGTIASFQSHSNVGVALLIGAGVSAILFRGRMASAQNRISALTADPLGPTRPATFVIWAIGILIVALAWLLGLIN
jgi:hypothetical protein